MIARVALVVLLVAGGGLAQVPLPDSLVGTVAFPDSLERMELPTASADSLQAWFGLSNTLGSSYVEVSWHYSRPGVGGVLEHQKVSVSFQPTAVCRRQLESNVVYVAGWIQRLGIVVVEKWVFGQAALAVTYPPSGGDPILDLTTPTIAKSVVFMSSPVVGMQPVTGLACSPYADSLFMLPQSNPRAILEVPASGAPGACGGQPCVVASEAAISALSVARHLAARKRLSGEFVITARETPPWAGNDLQEVTDAVAVLVDGDLDGDFDITYDTTVQGFNSIYPAWGWEGDSLPAFFP